jgi:hypothetical protein
MSVLAVVPDIPSRVLILILDNVVEISEMISVDLLMQSLRVCANWQLSDEIQRALVLHHKHCLMQPS